MKKYLITIALILTTLFSFSQTRDTTVRYSDGHEFTATFNGNAIQNFISIDGKMLTPEQQAQKISCFQSYVLECKKRLVCLCQCFDCDPATALPSIGCSIMFAWACFWGETPD